MSDANLASLAFAEEISLGVLPNQQLQSLRFTKESLGFGKETVVSQEIRSDRQVPDSVMVFGQSAGGFEFELSFGFVLPFIAAALQNEWETGEIEVVCTMNSGTQIITGSAGDFDDIKVGSIVVISGALTAGNNGPKRVAAKATDGSTITLRAGSIVTTDASDSVTFTFQTITNGVDRKSFTFEKRILNSEGGDFYQRYTGQVCDSLEITLESKKIIMGSAAFVGTGYDISDEGGDPGALANVAATASLTIASGNAVAGETFTVGGIVYTWVTTATSTPYDVEIGGSGTLSLTNAVAAINAAAGAGTVYGTGTAANPYVTATGPHSGPSLAVQAVVVGALGNLVAVSETMTNGTWGQTTLSGGVTAVGGYSEPEDGSIMNATNNVGTINLDAAAATDRFKSIKLTLSNNVRGKDAVSYMGNWDIGLGQFNVKGSVNAYFRNNTLPAKIKAHTTFGIDYYVQDPEGNRLYFFLPALKPSGGDPKIEGINTDVMIETAFEAIKSTVAQNPSGKMITIDAIPAAWLD